MAAGYAFSQQQNPGTKSQKPSSGNNTNTDLDGPPVQKPKSTEPGNPYQGLSDQKIADKFVEGIKDISTGNTTKNYLSSGGYEQALKDFKSLNLKNVKEITTPKFGKGLVGELPNGTRVVVRPGSKSNLGATIEFQFKKIGGVTYEIRYGD